MEASLKIHNMACVIQENFNSYIDALVRPSSHHNLFTAHMGGPLLTTAHHRASRSPAPTGRGSRSRS